MAIMPKRNNKLNYDAKNINQSGFCFGIGVHINYLYTFIIDNAKKGQYGNIHCHFAGDQRGRKE